MTFLFNILFAWISTTSLILLSIIWLLRIAQKKGYINRDRDLAKINKFLRKKHISLGYIFLISAFFHGMLSSYSLFSFNFGTIALIIGFLILETFNSKVTLGKKWMSMHRHLTIILIVLTIVHVIEVDGFVGVERIVNSVQNDLKPKTKTESVDKSSMKYRDGVYEGIGNGYGPNLKVSVTVENGKITEIEIIEHNERGENFYLPAMENIPGKIIEKQSTDVDTISGATFTSNGIMEAVENALSKAVEGV